MLEIPQTADEITPQWLTTALRSTGVLNKAAVASVSTESIGEEFGFASSIARLQIGYDSPQSGAPSSLIAKMSTSNPDQARSANLGEKFRREACFYERLAPAINIRVPRCYFVNHDSRTASICLLLEDLGGGRFGDAEKGWEYKEAELVVETFAQLHAGWWQDPRLEEQGWLPIFGTNTAEQLQRLVERRDTFLDRYGASIPGNIVELVRQLGPQHEALLNRLKGPPRTLLHVDAHLDNLVFLGQGAGEELVVYDWQGVAQGLCVVDLALFLLGTSVENRREHETELLRHYHTTLTDHGVTDYPFHQLLDDYRIAILRWWVGTINGLGSSYAATWTGRQADVARQSVDRWSAAVDDHQIMNLL